MKVEEKGMFKNHYTGIFSLNYMVQGINQSVLAILIPIYIINLLGTVSATTLAFVASLMMIPWSIKLIFGILSDKFGLKKLGRRKPWILFPVIIAGCIWIIISLPNILTPLNAIVLLAITGIIVNIGVAMGDTALDGMIMDLCPKEQLGRTQGFCWGFKFIGIISGGPVLAYLVVIVNVITIETTFMILGFLLIFTSLFVLFVKEAEEIPIVNIIFHIKSMFKKKRDWKLYLYCLFNSLLDIVIVMFLSLFILIQMGLIQFQGTSLSLGGTDVDVYLWQANVSLVISLGIIFGAILGGVIADLRTRRLSVILGLIITTIALLLMTLNLHWIYLLSFACLVGLAVGWRHSSMVAIAGEFAKNHPEMDSTYFSVANSFTNMGSIIGLVLTGIIFSNTGSFLIVFIFMAVISNFGLIPFLLIKSKDYEYKLNINDKK